jgi:hypothetical protein
MDLTIFFQISVSIFCIVATFTLIFFAINAVLMRLKLRKLINSLEQIAQNAADSSDDIKEFIDRTIDSVDRFKSLFFTYETLWKTANSIIDLIKSRRLIKTEKKSESEIKTPRRKK